MRTPKHRTNHEQSNNSLPRHDTCRRVIMRTPKHRAHHQGQWEDSNYATLVLQFTHFCIN